MRRQSEQIRMMSDREVLIHLYVTQLLLIVMSVIAGFSFLILRHSGKFGILTPRQC